MHCTFRSAVRKLRQTGGELPKGLRVRIQSREKSRDRPFHINSYYQAAGYRTAKKKFRKLEANIPRKGILGGQSQFPHSCVCERIIYSHDGAAVSAGGDMWTDHGNI